jgi:anaerobic ribonucleoside-triphosphate reductase activating protein
MNSLWERKLKLHTKEKREIKPEEVIQIASIVEESIVDGPGLRFVVFTQGCPHKCPGCHNPQTHNKYGGREISLEEILERFDKHEGLDGITISGGEPFEQSENLSKLAKEIHKRNKNVIVYTGYTLEKLKEMEKLDLGIEKLLDETDLLIDGPFLISRRSIELSFTGSTNQRLIPLTKTGERLLSLI